jgi:hypothetical protein
VAEVNELSKQIGDLAKEFNDFRVETTNRLTRIETKLESKNGNGKITALLIDIVKMIVAAAIGVLVGTKSLIP